MATQPVSEQALIEQFGPNLNQSPPGGWDAGLHIDRVVDTHCCFCGQQCGIKLKVHLAIVDPTNCHVCVGDRRIPVGVRAGHRARLPGKLIDQYTLIENRGVTERTPHEQADK